jgi:cytochrome c-type biogenesis protein CcmH/NrfG
LYSNDLYLRTYSQIYLVKLNSIASKGSSLSDADKADLQTSFDQVVNSAQMAVAYDPSNYLNFQLLGSVYQAVGSLGVKDAYGKAVLAYQTASSLNPLNPGLKLAMASVSFIDGKVQDAKDYANEALSLKQDYIDALITLSQIAKSENNNSGALSYAQAALSLAPTDKNLIQYVDSLNNPTSTPTPTPTPNKSKK